jgi:hypothetical protein
MGRRLDLQNIFLEITPHVYFQEPPTKDMAYPCILYKRDDADTKFAGNRPYSFRQRYLVTLITKDPDSDILDRIRALPLCLYDRGYAANNLNHDVFALYY